ncbi:MAG: anthranilate phosphoribosyltransferase [Candidatus Helarchaeota archaeon]
MIKNAIKKLIDGVDLNFQETGEVMKEIMSGKATDAQIGAFLASLRIKGETVEEIAACASVMREVCFKLNPKVEGRLVDTCGTGGDKIKTFNISTAAAFVVAGSGIPVAKHGNRSVTSQCGSADVLEHLGFNLDLEPQAVEKCIEEIGIGFMFAPKFHPAMKYAIGPRRQMGIRTIFNILGPLTNPAEAKGQILGTYSDELVEPLVHVLKELGTEAAYVVHGLEGLDEISIIGRTLIAELKDGDIDIKGIIPEDFGFKIAQPHQIAGTTPKESAILLFKILNNLLDREDPRRNVVLLNAAAGIVVGGKVDTLKEGIELAKETLEKGRAYEKLRKMVKNSNGDMGVLEDLEQTYT